MKIMKNLYEKHENPENHRNPLEKYENNENHRNP